nr:DNA-directed RNA polymerases IV and V subunit 2-like [Tanacetum cinerariifolium]
MFRIGYGGKSFPPIPLPNVASLSALERLRPGYHNLVTPSFGPPRQLFHIHIHIPKNPGVKSDRGVVDLIDADIEDGNIVNILIASIHAADQECDDLLFLDVVEKLSIL